MARLLPQPVAELVFAACGLVLALVAGKKARPVLYASPRDAEAPAIDAGSVPGTTQPFDQSMQA